MPHAVAVEKMVSCHPSPESSRASATPVARDAEERALRVARGRPPRAAAPHGRGPATARARTCPASRARPSSRSSRIAGSRAVRALPFSAATRAATSTPGICRSIARWANAGPERGRLGRDIRGGIQQRVAERRLVAGRELALDLAAGGRGGELVELVEQARDLVGPGGIEVDRVIGLGAQEQEAELLRRHDLGDRRGRPRRAPWRSTSSCRRCSGTRTGR